MQLVAVVNLLSTVCRAKLLFGINGKSTNAFVLKIEDKEYSKNYVDQQLTPRMKTSLNAVSLLKVKSRDVQRSERKEGTTIQM